MPVGVGVNMDTQESTSYRARVVDSIERHLFGPANGPTEVVTGKPFWRYLSGILFPNQLDPKVLGDALEEPLEDAGASDEGVEDPVIATAYDSLPSSMGVTFFVSSGTGIECLVEGSRYAPSEAESSRDVWQRVPIAEVDGPERIYIPLPENSPETDARPIVREALGGRAVLHTVVRRYSEGSLITVTLLNAQTSGGVGPQRQTEQILFQCRFRVTVVDGEIIEYPTTRRYSMHSEDEELALAYRQRKTYGIGHGCAATWTAVDGTVRSLVADPLPRQEVQGLTNDISLSDDAERALSVAWLADERTPFEDLVASMRALVRDYETWSASQLDASKVLETDDQVVARRMVERQRLAARRMRLGIDVLEHAGADGDATRAFRIAQRAMVEQFGWTQRVGGQTYDVGKSPVLDQRGASESPTPFRWRPFQMAFQLLVLESIVDQGSEFRDVLDLLWFPTGGGKTEAYLALSAFEIAIRRLRHGDAGGGTAVLMRYTLRLLTNQQFERCATLVSAMEWLRRCHPELGLGDVPISLGLWVGGDTPNRLSGGSGSRPGAQEVYEDLLAADVPENPFKLLNCPYCGTRIVPKRKSPLDAYGVRVTANSFRIWCPDERCPLSKGIPVSVVDEDIYQNPPSVIIGTIDKFARMVWEPRSRALLGFERVSTDDGDLTEVLPPSLIIQDELHLINGPLGTIAGMYEAAIDTAIARRGVDVKYLAATATIQRAHEQVRALYARDAALFPPPGLDASDSFFSREDRLSPGRMYIGAMNTGVYTSLTTLVQASAAAAQAVQELAEGAETDDDALAVDSYWTQVIYHNSRQELGKTTTLLRDDVLTRLRSLAPDDVQRRFDRVVELSGNLKSGYEVSKALEDLKIGWPDDDAIDVLACTNMISVGVDVERLGLMIVKGQPKTTAEYIQATSRVGRSSKRPPGVVLTLYTSSRPRDRSHFENFPHFHQTLYRAVEPSTVTPFALPAIERTLHAAIVLAVRHVLGFVRPEQARDFSLGDPRTRAALEALEQRIARACPEDHWDEVKQRFDRIVETWEEAANEKPTLRFEPSRQFPSLLEHPTNSAGWSVDPPWPALSSMRHVDGEAPIMPVVGAQS